MTHWPTNLGPDGKPTFLLPGESAITSEVMRQRSQEYYKQIRGRYSPRDSIARYHLAKIKGMLNDQGIIPQDDDHAKRPPAPPPYRK